jgi:endoglycosylceramidase
MTGPDPSTTRRAAPPLGTGRLVALLLGLALIAACSDSRAPGSSAATFAHAGRWLTDEQGRVVILHGLNWMDKTAPYLPSAIGLDGDDADFLRDQGFNAVRFGWMLTGLEPRPGEYSDTYLEALVRETRVLTSRGIAVLIDLHQDQYNERFHGQGFPDWAVLDDGLPANPDRGFPGNYFSNPALWRTFENFWANRPAPDGVGVQDHVAEAWRRLAERFRGEPGVIGFDVMNEPFVGSVFISCTKPQGCAAFEREELAPFFRRVLAAVRSVDPDRLVFYEPVSIFNPPTHLGPIGDGDTGFSFHVYAGDEDALFSNADREAASDGGVPLLTEFGSTAHTDAIVRVAGIADRYRIGWLEWTYFSNGVTDTAGTPSLVLDPRLPPGGSNVDPDQLEALARPYPQAIAGTPLEFGFDPQTRAFHLVYSTARADGGDKFQDDTETVIAVPSAQYPTGYAVEVDGGAVRSSPDDGLLRVVACPSAMQVMVRVAPEGATRASCGESAS